MKGFRSDLWCELQRTLGAGSRTAYTLTEVPRRQVGVGGWGGIKRCQEACVRSERWGCMQLGHQPGLYHHWVSPRLQSSTIIPGWLTLASCDRIHHWLCIRSSLCLLHYTFTLQAFQFSLRHIVTIGQLLLNYQCNSKLQLISHFHMTACIYVLGCPCNLQ